MENSLTFTTLKERLDQGIPTVIIDVRSKEEFAAQHILQAVNIPLDLLEQIAPLLEKERFYVTACGKGGGRSTEAANALMSFGLHAFWLEGGTIGWYEQGNENKTE